MRGKSDAKDMRPKRPARRRCPQQPAAELAPSSTDPEVLVVRPQRARTTSRERKILHRIAAGGLYVTPRRDGFSFIFSDGTTVQGEFGRFDFHKFTALGWIEADPDAPALFPDLVPAQRYQVAPAWRS